MEKEVVQLSIVEKLSIMDLAGRYCEQGAVYKDGEKEEVVSLYLRMIGAITNVYRVGTPV